MLEYHRKLGEIDRLKGGDASRPGKSAGFRRDRTRPNHMSILKCSEIRQERTIVSSTISAPESLRASEVITLLFSISMLPALKRMSSRLPIRKSSRSRISRPEIVFRRLNSRTPKPGTDECASCEIIGGQE